MGQDYARQLHFTPNPPPVSPSLLVRVRLLQEQKQWSDYIANYNNCFKVSLNCLTLHCSRYLIKTSTHCDPVYTRLVYTDIVYIDCDV